MNWRFSGWEVVGSVYFLDTDARAGAWFECRLKKDRAKNDTIQSGNKLLSFVAFATTATAHVSTEKTKYSFVF